MVLVVPYEKGCSSQAQGENQVRNNLLALSIAFSSRMMKLHLQLCNRNSPGEAPSKMLTPAEGSWHGTKIDICHPDPC